MGQLYGQVKQADGTTNWKPIEAILEEDGTYSIRVNTELVLDSGNVTISNLKVGSVDQTVSGSRWVRTLDDGTIVATLGVDDPLAGFNVARSVDSGAFPRYFGLVDIDENWIIIEEDKSGNEKSYKYFTGAGSFLINWGNKAILVYDEYYNTF